MCESVGEWVKAEEHGGQAGSWQVWQIITICVSFMLYVVKLYIIF